MTEGEFQARLAEVSRVVATLDASDPAACEAALNRRFPADGAAMQAFAAAAVAKAEAGTICDRGDPTLRYSRVVKPENDPAGCSVDAVRMDRAAGPAHTHPNGEFCFCIAESGEPTFEGRRDAWIVLPKASRHVPTVAGGRMLILYWLPQGAVKWG